MPTYYSYVFNTTECQSIINNTKDNDTMRGSLEFWQVTLLIAIIGILAASMAKVFNFIRKIVYRDKDNVDDSFDAGGKVSMGLTATTIVSQWTWAATLLQSSAVATKYGIAGTLWYAAGAAIQVLLFSMIGVQLKIRAPGAKTFLQVIKARFGSRTHIVFCVFGLATNVIVTSMLMLGGAAVLRAIVNGLSTELAVAMIVAVVGTYTFIGGMGAIFYVSYFNTAIILIIILIFLTKVFYNSSPDNPLGSIRKVYDLMSCGKATTGNEGDSYLTMHSSEGLMFGIINIVGNFGTVFVDQSYWQCSVATKPKQGALGFIFGGLTWFAVPFTFATAMGLSYISLSSSRGEAMLTVDEVNEGLVAPFVAHELMGFSGDILITIMMLLAVTSTASAEVVAVTSILVYDVYQLYLKPYRLTLDSNSCILCGSSRGRYANPRDKCVCISMTFCPSCSSDDERRSESKRAIKPPYTCTTHGPYREYNEFLAGLKNWCLLWVTLAIIPLTLILSAVNVSLGWVYSVMGVLVGSAVIPIALCMFWTRLTGIGMIVGGIGGAVVGVGAWLTVASTRPDGLSNFMVNTGDELSNLCGNVCAIMCGGLFTVIVSFITNRNYDPSNTDEIWESTRDIDNPLCPWTERSARDLNLQGANQLDNRPPLEEVAAALKRTKLTAYIFAPIATLSLVAVWPAAASASGVFTFGQFQTWITVVTVWGFCATVFIIIMPLISEGLELRASLKELKQVAPCMAPPPMKVGEAARKPSGKPANVGPTPGEIESETKDSHEENGGVVTAEDREVVLVE